MKRNRQGLKGALALLRDLRPYRWKLLGAILCGVCKEVCIIGAAGICAWLVATVASGAALTDRFWFFLLAAVVAGRGLFTFLESMLSHDVAYHILVDFRVKLYRAFTGGCPDLLLRSRSGQISTTLMNDVERLEWFYAHTVGVVVVDTVLFVFLVAFLGWLHIALALLLVGAVALILAVPFFMKGRAEEQGRQVREDLGEANAVTLEGINGLGEILTLNYREAYRAKSRDYMERLTRSQVAYARRMGTEGGLLQIASGVSAALINLCGVYLVRTGALALPWFAVLGTTVWLMFTPLLELCTMARNFGLIFASADRIHAILAGPPLVPDTGTEVTAPEDLSVTFDQVHFRYAGGKEEVLRGVSFRAEQGKVLALVGASGAGKTTCSHLLVRMWDPSAGTIRIGGTDVRAFSLRALRQLVSLVPQDVYLFHMSIRDNIRLGRPEATDAEVEEAARMARIHTFILSLPQGYDTNAGERGLQMSGGQRQRIAIARALIMNTPILVLDEAVSNLDARTDRQIQQTIHQLARKKTIILVAHRLSTIREADHVVALGEGRVLEEGSHEALLRSSADYRALTATQLQKTC